MDKIPISSNGFEFLQQELKRLKNEERPKVIKMIEFARSLGDLSENAEYETAKDQLRAKGINIFLEEDRQGGAVNGPRAYFHDPDGNVLEIINLTSYKGKIS